MGSERAAPAVVVVVVASDPGDWFEEALLSLAAQDYDNYSVVVVDASATEGVPDRVRKVLPAAQVSRVLAATSFAESVNRGVAKVEGVAHVLVCHDDVALAPDALRLLVEEAYRRNGGLTCPKLVRWDAPERLLSVGLGADRLGVAHPLVEQGELDQGQHDAAREVFLAPALHCWCGPTCGRPWAGSTPPWAARERTPTCAGGRSWRGPGSWWRPTPTSATSKRGPMG